MKKYILLLIIAFSLSARSQVVKPEVMIIHYEGGLTKTVDLTGATYFEFSTQKLQKAKENNPEKGLIGIWTYPLSIGLSISNTTSSGIENISLVFEENGTMHYVYKIGYYSHDKEPSFDYSTSKDYPYEISDNTIKIKGETELEFILQYDYLTIRQTGDVIFPPSYSYIMGNLPVQMTYHKEPSL